MLQKRPETDWQYHLGDCSISLMSNGMLKIAAIEANPLVVQCEGILARRPEKSLKCII